jgi:hypothetical protein
VLSSPVVGFIDNCKFSLVIALPESFVLNLCSLSDTGTLCVLPEGPSTNIYTVPE